MMGNIVSIEKSKEREQIKSAFNLSDEDIKKIEESRKLFSTKFGIMSRIPLICQGPNCMFASSCMYKDDEAILGKKCPVEIGILSSFFDAYIESLGIDTMNISELSLVRDLVDIEIKLMRCQEAFSASGTFEQDVKQALEDGTEVVVEKRLAIHVKYAEMLKKEKAKILEMLVATREKKMELDRSYIKKDITTILSEIKR